MERGLDNENMEFEFFKNYNIDEMELYKVFPFYDSYENESKQYDVIFPHMNFYNLDVHKNIMDGDQLLEKITQFEKSYSTIVQNDIMSAPTTSKIYF